jgi:RHS repeat-associated protein
LVKVANQNTPLATYAYNYLGQRAAKTASSAITQFVYDGIGQLLAENNGATGAAQTEYVWLDDMPLALVTGGNLHFIHTDHLGTPQKATDARQNLAWDIVPRPFGQTEQQTFPPLSNLRFPGQYFDSESGLAQNWFRDYDPAIGRYIESDPIGLKGGVNTYAYVLANPLRHTDVTGRQTRDDIIVCLSNPTLCSVPELKACRVESTEHFYDSLQQWIADTALFDNKFRGRKNVACHRWAEGQFDRCRKGEPREPFRL